MKLGPHERIRNQKGSPACICILEKLLAMSHAEKPGKKDKVIVVQPRASMTLEWAVQEKFRENAGSDGGDDPYMLYLGAVCDEDFKVEADNEISERLRKEWWDTGPEAGDP